MAIASDNVFPKIIGAEQGSDPAAASAGQRKLYAKADGWYDIDDAGVATGPFGTGGGGAAFAGAKVYRSAAYSLANNALTAMPWDAEEYDTDGFHDNTTNNERLTVPSGLAGKYDCKVNIGTDVSGATYTRFILLIRKNGAGIRGGRAESNYGSSSFPTMTLSVDVDLAVGDYIDAAYLQISGGTRNFHNADCAMSMHRIG